MMASEKTNNNSAEASAELPSLHENNMEHSQVSLKSKLVGNDVSKPLDAGGGEEVIQPMEADASAIALEKKDNDTEKERCSPSPKKKEEMVDFKIVFNKQRHDVHFSLDETIAALKKHAESLIGVPPSMQKVMYRGLCKDDKTLRDAGFTKGAKVMIVGSTLSDIIAVNTPGQQDAKEDKPSTSQKEPFCKQKLHKKIVDKGLPEDAQPGIKNVKDGLPPYPISGMVNKSGGKVRLTFKLELDQVWIGTKERTDKIPMNSIKDVVSEAIEGHEEYHIMGIQLGPTEASRYWLYWVPAQYVDAIKDAVLGKWQYF